MHTLCITFKRGGLYRVCASVCTSFVYMTGHISVVRTRAADSTSVKHRIAYKVQVIISEAVTYADDRQCCNEQFIGKLLCVLLSYHCLAINAGQQQGRSAVMSPVCHANESASCQTKVC